MDSDRIQPMIECRVEKHRQQLAYLETCYRDEMAKTCHLRNTFCLFFLVVGDVHTAFRDQRARRTVVPASGIY